MPQAFVPSKCPRCDTDIPYAARECLGCGNDIGFPNIRAADVKSEKQALQERVRQAHADAKKRGCETQLESFGTAVLNSNAVIVHSLMVLNDFISTKHKTLPIYYGMVQAGARVPENNEFDANRGRMDSIINLFGTHERIQFAALSLNYSGVSWYGDYSITLREDMIAARSSVFEENPFTFFLKHPVPPKGFAPAGYRATWNRRAELAMAKLYAKIDNSTVEAEFESILIDQGTCADDSDFIEVHIYGSIHPRAVAHVRAKAPKDRADQAIWARVKRHLSDLGATYDEV